MNKQRQTTEGTVMEIRNVNNKKVVGGGRQLFPCHSKYQQLQSINRLFLVSKIKQTIQQD